MKRFIINIISGAGSVLFFFKKRNINSAGITSILINSLYFIGDTVFHTPVIEALRYLFPNAKIDIWVKSRNYDIVKNNPALNEILVFDKIKTADYKDESGLNLAAKINFIKKIRNKKYSLYIDLTGKYSTALIALLGGFKNSAGLNYNSFGFCYNKYCELDTSHSEGHLIDKYLSVVKCIFDLDQSEWNELLKKIKPNPYLYLDNEAINNVNKELTARNITGSKPLISIHSTAGWKAKELDSEKFALLLKSLSESKKYDIVIVGDKSDAVKIDEIQGFAGNTLNVMDLFIPLGLTGTIELIKRANLFIGSDSAPLHIAGAVGTPSIALFGPTNPEFSKPRGQNHLVVYHELYCSAAKNEQFCTRNAGKTCPTIDCMKNITVNEILKKTEFLLNQSGVDS